MRLIRKKSWDESGVSEVVGTILILGMTVVLFSTVLLWIYAIPTPTPDVKVDFQGTLQPIYKPDGTWNGVNITLLHNSGEKLGFYSTEIYLNLQKSSQNWRYTEKLKLRGTLIIPPDSGKPYGLIDGPDNNWNVGERWSYTNHSIGQNVDRIEVLIIDTDKSVLLWQRVLKGLVGLNPPVFIDKWADKDPATPTLDTPKTGSQFYLFAQVVDPDGDLNKKSVYTTVTAFYGSKDFRENPQRMYDDGTHGDSVGNDTIFSFTASWLKPGNISWDGSVVIFNATDLQGHKATSRLTLSVLLGTGGGTTPGKRPGSGAPPNLKYNGLQGFNLFNATEWDYNPYGCNETRTFKEGETVVVVVASALMKNSKGAHNEFYLYDPFSNLPPEPVVYGNSKTPTPDTQASNTLAFTFFEYINGYNVFTYRFDLNNASSVGINYYTNPTHPPYYFFGRYSLDITIWDDVQPQPTKFHTTDTINITDANGNMRQYPKLETFKNSAYTINSNTFNSTDTVWVRVTMKTVDSSYFMGMVAVQDYLGGTQVWRSPLSGKYVNAPICPVTAACITGNTAVEMHAGSVSYRFSLNLSMANQDPWVPGTQNYALRVMSMRDIDEEYTLALQSQLTISAPDFLLDVAIVNDDTSNNAWGTHDLAYYFEDINGADRWGNPPVRVFTGSPPPNAWLNGIAIRYLDFDLDGDLDIAASFLENNQNSWLYLFRRDLDTSGNTIWTPFIIEGTGNNPVTAIATGSLDRDTAPEIVIGKTNGAVGYYKNDGSWTWSVIDTRTAKINSIDVGDFDGDGDNDVAVAINVNTNQVYWYPNLDGNGKFTTTQTTTHWTAVQESTTYGTIVAGNYTSTQTDDANREQLREERRSFPPTYTNNTANAEATFTYGSISSGSYLDTQTNNNVYEALVEGTCQAQRQCLQAYWPISAPSGDTYKIKVKAHKSSGSSPNEDFKFQWATATGGPWTDMFTVTVTSDAWFAYGGGANLSLSGYSTVYVRVVDSIQQNSETADTIYVDYMYLETYIGPRDTSALEHYWKLQTLPTGPSSTYTMRVKGYRPTNSESDNFQFSYSTTGQSGTYSNTILVNTATETMFTYTLPNVGGSTVWVKVVDTDRTDNAINEDSVYVNLLEIMVDTPGGITGYAIALPSGTAATILDAGYQDADIYADLAVGTANGNTYKVKGSAGGLITPSAVFASPGGSISGIKLANCFPAKTGLEIVASSGASVYIYQADGATGTLLKTLTTPNSETIKALAAGNVDADGSEDVVVTTGGTNIGRIVYFKNAAGSWYIPMIPQFIIGVPIWGIDLGDASNSLHRGR